MIVKDCHSPFGRIEPDVQRTFGSQCVGSGGLPDEADGWRNSRTWLFGPPVERRPAVYQRHAAICAVCRTPFEVVHISLARYCSQRCRQRDYYADPAQRERRRARDRARKVAA